MARKLSEAAFQRLLDIASKAAQRRIALETRLRDAFMDRYGIHYSDASADSVVDTLDYGHGTLTVEQCDADMEMMGYPKLAGRDALSSDEAARVRGIVE